MAKAYGVGKALHLAVLLIAVLKNSLLTALVTLGWSLSCLDTVVSCHVKELAAQREVGWPFIRF